MTSCHSGSRTRCNTEARSGLPRVASTTLIRHEGRGSRDSTEDSLAVPDGHRIGRVRVVHWLTQKGGGLIIVAVILAAVNVYVGAGKPDNELAGAVLQGIALVFGVYGSYVLGKASAFDARDRITEARALSALRRMLNLYRALGRQRKSLSQQMFRLDQLAQQQNPNGRVEIEHVRGSFMTLEAMVTEQINTAGDALEDWRELLPDEVARIEKQVQEPDGEIQ